MAVGAAKDRPSANSTKPKHPSPPLAGTDHGKTKAAGNAASNGSNPQTKDTPLQLPGDTVRLRQRPTTQSQDNARKLSDAAQRAREAQAQRTPQQSSDSPRAANNSQGQDRSTGTTNRPKWTYAVYLASSQTDSQGHTGGAASKGSAERLQELARDSKGHPEVRLLVEVVHRPSIDSNHPPAPGERPAKGTTETWEVHDGNLRRIDPPNPQDPARPSEGFAKDVEKLLARAKDTNPEHLGLTIQAHGNGNGLGLSGDQGRGNGDSATLDQLRDAVRQGLGGNGQGPAQRLDMLDLDCCLEGNTATLERMRDVTRNLVASAETETGTGSATRSRIDGQNIQGVMDRLLQHPEMDGHQLGQAFVEQADADQKANRQSAQDHPGENPEKIYDGTPTLANFDLEKYEPFRQAMGDLGDRLADAIKGSSGNRAAIERVIAATRRYDTGGMDQALGDRDLKDFVQRLQKALDQPGDFGGDTTALRRACQQTLEQLQNLEGQPHVGEGYERTGALGAPLPSGQFFDPNAFNRVNAALNLAKADPGANESLDDLKGDAGDIAGNYLHDHRGQMTAQEVNDLQAASAGLQQAQTSDQAREALKRWQQVWQKLQGSPSGQAESTSAKERHDQYLQESLKNALQPGSEGWRRFVETLGEHPPSA